MLSNYEKQSNNYVSAFCDGGGSKEAGFSYAYVIYTEDGFLLHRYGEKIENLPLVVPQKIYSSNQAEYVAVINLLIHILSVWVDTAGHKPENNVFSVLAPSGSRVNVFMDSQLVVNQINKVYKTNDILLKQLLDRVDASRLVLQNANISLRFYWIPRESNKVADKLQKEVANARDI
jgi:ribonuclease HI